MDPVCGRLTYEEFVGGEGRRLHGWLHLAASGGTLWRGDLALLEPGGRPWYGPPWHRGQAPEAVGSIQVRPIPGSSPAAMETQIKVAGEDDDWQEPVRFQFAPFFFCGVRA